VGEELLFVGLESACDAAAEAWGGGCVVLVNAWLAVVIGRRCWVRRWVSEDDGRVR
jgi:hypothetical protein